MDVQINLLGVLLAAASALVVGMVWYSGSLFGKEWTKVTGVSDKDMKKAMPQAISKTNATAPSNKVRLERYSPTWFSSN